MSELGMKRLFAAQDRSTERAYSLRDAEFYFRSRLDDGLPCPCCKRYAKRYRRKINSSMARAAIYLAVNAKPGKWIHWSIISRISWEVSKLAWWGLVEHKSETDGVRKTSGFWRITPKGRGFVRGEITLPKFALFFNNTVEEFAGDRVSIQECLASKFNYEELMKGQ